MSLRNQETFIDRRHVLGLAAGLTPAVVLGAPAVATAAPREPAGARQAIPVSARRKDPDGARRAASAEIAEAAAAGNVTVEIDFQYQETGYWCGPAATRHALSARGVNVSQQQMANELPTSTNGTDWIGQVTRVLSNHVGWYETKEMPNDPPTQAQRDLLWRDVTYDLDRGYALVTNIVAPASNHPPGYPNYTIWHYFTVIGYNPDNSDVLIADSAGFAPTATYWLTFNQLATLIPPKGYSA
ncbi:C39 family peptidase [Microlunatus speluncae]|uniref:C39 family peptidase n=1 Tax=Microlunatus speluncae TaxID=2594267 RepID=UPI00126614E8|nr:C39 family peptidase [Microlunatus speluncae]